MDSLLTSPISIRIDGRVILRAEIVPGAGGICLQERDGTNIDLDIPLAALLGREDLRAAARPGGAELLLFLEGERRLRLVARRVPGGARLLVLFPDEIERDVHEISLEALLMFENQV